MVNRPDSNKARQTRHKRVRAKISGTAECPRLNVFRSLQNIYAQLIDDVKGVTLCAACTKNVEMKKANAESAAKVGELIAKKALEAGITEVVFDRGGFLYHGKVKSLADAAREAGLKF